MVTTSSQIILEKLVCKDIPDTRKLQQLRIDSLDTISQYEKIMREHYPDKDETTYRLIKIPQHELEKVYRGAIPLSFPSCDFWGNRDIETNFFRWTSWDYQQGAMHLTTEKSLNNLLRIFVNNKIPIQQEVAYGKVFDVEIQGRPGISVLHSSSGGYGDSFFRHQFVVCKQNVIGVPYYFTEDIITREGKQEEGYNHVSFEISKKRTQQKTYFCKAIFSSPDHIGDITPKNYIPKMLEDKRKNKIENWDESRWGKLENVEIDLLRIGDPILIYDPKWVEN